jgi:1-aminocyclopropane-1-carboxylate deaminase/D-cysteine desulfhydrase-like pyridoxal-dependent ACC family enzyme
MIPGGSATCLRSSFPEQALAAIDRVRLFSGPSPLEEPTRLRSALGPGTPRLFVKRDDALPFGFGGNKVRKLEYYGRAAVDAGADTLVTVGGVQSNHARATAALAAFLGLDCTLVLNGVPPDPPRGNALLDHLLGADVVYIAGREEREPATREVCARLRQEGRRPFLVPLGASTPLGALGFVRAIAELADQGLVPDVIVHASSSGGTQAGIEAGCRLRGWGTRVIGVSADEPADRLSDEVAGIVRGVGELLGVDLRAATLPVVDDHFVGEGYGLPTAEGREAQALAARCEALFLDDTYTAKAMAALLAYIRDGRISPDDTVLFWHTGGQAGLFA